MPKVNYLGSGHGRFLVRDPKTGDEARFWEFDMPQTIILGHAFILISMRSLSSKRCNDCFKRLPGGRSFDEVWKDGEIWISYDSRTDRGWYGVTMEGRKEISLSQSAFNEGVERVAGTLVHELAHTNGAPTTTGQADDTLLECDFKKVHQGVIGARRISLPTRMA
jgi:hypothetical protein